LGPAVSRALVGLVEEEDEDEEVEEEGTYGKLGSIINHFLKVRHGLGTSSSEGLAESIRHTWVSGMQYNTEESPTESKDSIETVLTGPPG
jgi:hypothetical protein